MSFAPRSTLRFAMLALALSAGVLPAVGGSDIDDSADVDAGQAAAVAALAAAAKADPDAATLLAWGLSQLVPPAAGGSDIDDSADVDAGQVSVAGNTTAAAVATPESKAALLAWALSAGVLDDIDTDASAAVAVAAAVAAAAATPDRVSDFAAAAAAAGGGGDEKPEADADDEEADRVTEFNRGSSARFSSVTFGPNVLAGTGAVTEHWIVFFCYSWYDGCKTTQLHYGPLAGEISRDYNRDLLFSSVVRFAEVDCATERELCNEQLVEQYPTVVHYTGGERGKAWTGGSKGASATSWAEKLDKWVRKRLVKQDGATVREEEERSTDTTKASVVRAAVFFAVVVTMLGALVGHGLELRRQLAPSTGPKAKPSALNPAALEGEEAAMAVPGPPEDCHLGRLRRSLPKEWAEARTTIEL